MGYLKYRFYFDEYDNFGYSYTFEPDRGEVIDYIKRTYKPDELTHLWYNLLSPKDKQWAADELKVYGEEDLPKIYEDAYDWILDDLLDFDAFDEELKDYFEDEAREEAYDEYEDQKAYERDPYSYFGLRRSDFE